MALLQKFFHHAWLECEQSFKAFAFGGIQFFCERGGYDVFVAGSKLAAVAMKIVVPADEGADNRTIEGLSTEALLSPPVTSITITEPL